MLFAAPMQRILLSFLFLALTSPLAACSSVVVEADTISGTVANVWGDPTTGVRVAVGDTVTTTDSAGHFEVPAVADPYEVTLFDPQTKGAYVYASLTGQDHSFRVQRSNASSTVNQHVAPFTVKFPEKDSDSVVSVFGVELVDNVAEGYFLADNPSQSTAQEHPLTAHWRGESTVKVRVQAFRIAVDPVSKAIKHYVGYDSIDVSVTDGAPAAVAVSWEAPPFGEAKISVTPELGSPTLFIYNTDVSIRSPAGSALLGCGTVQGSELSFVVPDIAGALFDVSLNAGDKSEAGQSSVSYATARLPGLVAGAKGATIAVEPGASLVSPHDGGAFGVGTKLEWSPKGDGASLASLYPLDPDAGDISYSLATRDGAVVVPDLSRLGVTLAKGQKYGWIVYTNSLTPTVEDIATRFTPTSSPTEASSFAGSPTWTLTTQ